MIEVSFEDYAYFPTLRTRQAELKGLDQLDAKRKSQILPILTLGRWPKAINFNRAAEKAQEAMGTLPYFLDLTTDANHLAQEQQALRNPAQGFEAWRIFTSNYVNTIPVVQLSSDARVREVAKQARELEKSVGLMAFRIREFSTETPTVINALSALDDPRNAMVFVDCQFIRSALAAYVTATVATINQLRQEFPELIIAVLSTSFPASTVPFADATGRRGSIDILERNLHQRIGGTSVAAYGDHASVHSVVYDDAPIMRWAARVDYPRELDWYFERRPQDQSAQGYSSAAQAVLQAEPLLGTTGIWGEEMIRGAATGTPHAKAPGPWISVRVNIHLARQIDFSNRLKETEEDEDEDGSDS